jgi:hypothetical protein
MAVVAAAAVAAGSVMAGAVLTMMQALSPALPDAKNLAMYLMPTI